MRKLSVRLSVGQTCGLWQNGRKICPDFYTIRKIIKPSFLRRMVGGATPSTWNFGSAGPRWSKIADFEPIFARWASAVTPSEKSSVNTNRKSTTRFPMSLRWSSYVAPKPPPPRGAQKRKTADFRLKSRFAWKKSATEFLCVKTVSGKLVMHCIHWPNYPCKNDWWGDPFYLKFWIKLTALEWNCRFSISFRSYWLSYNT